MKKKLWSRNLEKYVTNPPEIFVRLRRSYTMWPEATRLKFPWPTAAQCASEKKSFNFSGFSDPP